MYKVGIIVPVYYSDEDVASCLMKLTQCNYHNIKPTLYIPITGARESFIKDFMATYMSSYSMESDTQTDAIFSSIELEFDDTTFDPIDMINGYIAENIDLDYVAIIEPKVGFENLNWLQEFVSIFNLYDYRRRLGALCTDNKTHNIYGENLIRWPVDGEHTIVRTLDGDGFGDGVLFTELHVWKLVKGFKGKKYTDNFAHSCFKNGYLMTYVEGVR